MPIGIIGAMDAEIVRLLENMDDVKQIHIQGNTYHQGQLADQEVVLCKSGVGKVNAAICTQLLITQFKAKEIIFTGVAGAIHEDLDIGDICISSECQQHDVDASSLGFEKGIIPYQESSIFKADPELIRLAEEAAKSIPDVKVLTGKILSGDQFISNVKTVENLYRAYNGICVEMEGAAVGHVCSLANIPFVIIRSMSDRADHSASFNFVEFTKLAAERSCHMVQQMLKEA
ncbi:5'-methylthioadenosine/adenosylhomocysteine nucleosidase [Hazenella sp. IB182357]|uniref:adenosylhomocysteine nucleosidase n=1 Tax=Polycladospora coralii TaxID=2771432 RepID=A0A926NC88_9BACL|nr:5'-methylthioadenosine/adenosylhomocysteine nucleosidase [Polycladospora coralii]MBD1370929.1 5'-methylthioadenosine/adenosylhomocysteine nucleosidase [Polycladospora coralii]